MFVAGSSFLVFLQYSILQIFQGSILQIYKRITKAPRCQMSKWLSVHVDGLLPDHSLFSIWHCYSVSGKYLILSYDISTYTRLFLQGIAPYRSLLFSPYCQRCDHPDQEQIFSGPCSWKVQWFIKHINQEQNNIHIYVWNHKPHSVHFSGQKSQSMLKVTRWRMFEQTPRKWRTKTFWPFPRLLNRSKSSKSGWNIERL